jgi:Ca2+-binding EF-hand superfamily protein
MDDESLHILFDMFDQNGNGEIEIPGLNQIKNII